jgi:hypothetical protein
MFPVLLYGILLPALVAGIVLLAGGRGTPLAERPRPFLGALALGVGYLIAHVAIVGAPPVPWGDQQLPAQQWIAWFVLAAIVLAPLRGIERWAAWANAGYLALFSVVVLRQSLANVETRTFERFAYTLGFYAIWTATERLAARARGPALPAALVVAGTGISLSALMMHSASVAQLAGAVCAGLGAAGVIGLVDAGFHLAVGAVAIAMIVFGSAIVNAAIYDLPGSSIVLLAASCVTPWIGELPAFARLSPKKKACVFGILAAVPAAIAVWLAQAAGGAKSHDGY